MIYRFSKPGFKDRQSNRLNKPGKRYGILIDCGLNRDAKILTLHKQKDPTLLGLYLEILFNLDIQSEAWEIRSDHLFQLVKQTFDVGNRYDLKSRLEWLRDNELIQFQEVAIDASNDSHASAKGISLASHDPVMGVPLPSHTPVMAESRCKLDPLEPPQIQSGTEHDFTISICNTSKVSKPSNQVSDDPPDEKIDFKKITQERYQRERQLERDVKARIQAIKGEISNAG